MFEDEIGNRWNCDYVFNDFNEAKKHLKDEGFIENNRLFTRENHIWITYQKAFINPIQIYT